MKIPNFIISPYAGGSGVALWSHGGPSGYDEIRTQNKKVDTAALTIVQQD
jgi:hypothetical protein